MVRPIRCWHCGRDHKDCTCWWPDPSSKLARSLTGPGADAILKLTDRGITVSLDWDTG